MFYGIIPTRSYCMKLFDINSSIHHKTLKGVVLILYVHMHIIMACFLLFRRQMKPPGTQTSGRISKMARGASITSSPTMSRSPRALTSSPPTPAWGASVAGAKRPKHPLKRTLNSQPRSRDSTTMMMTSASAGRSLRRTYTWWAFRWRKMKGWVLLCCFQFYRWYFYMISSVSHCDIHTHTASFGLIYLLKKLPVEPVNLALQALCYTSSATVFIYFNKLLNNK